MRRVRHRAMVIGTVRSRSVHFGTPSSPFRFRQRGRRDATMVAAADERCGEVAVPTASAMGGT